MGSCSWYRGVALVFAGTALGAACSNSEGSLAVSIVDGAPDGRDHFADACNPVPIAEDGN